MGGGSTNDVSVFYGTGSTRYNTAGLTVNPSVWMQETATYDGSNIKLYLNGVYTGISSSVAAPLDSSTTGNLVIGSRPVSDYMWFNGRMSDVQLYNTALSPTQVTSLYSEGIGGAPLLPASNVGWWQFNGNMNDYSGNGNNGQNAGPTNVAFASNYIGNYIVPVSNVVLDLGQSVTFTGATTDANTPYSYNYIITNTVTGTQILSTLYSSCSLTTNTLVWTPAASLVGNTMQANVVVKDTYSIVSNSVKTGNIILNPALQPLKAGNFNSVLPSVIDTGDTGLPFGNKPRSMFGWVYLTQHGDGYTIHEYGTGGVTNEQSVLIIDTVTNYPIYRLKFEAYSGNDFEPASLSVPLNTWTFVGYTWNGVTNTITVYSNGASQSSVKGALNTVSSGSAAIGRANYEYGNWFPGDIANIQMYNIDLSPAQEASLYAEGLGGTPVLPSNIVGWWPLNGNSIDYSGKGNNGVDTSMSYVGTVVASNSPEVNTGQYEFSNHHGRAAPHLIRQTIS